GRAVRRPPRAGARGPAGQKAPPRLRADAIPHPPPAVVEVQPDPIPAARARREILARPFVVEPGESSHRLAPAPALDHAAHGGVRATVVVARLTRLGGPAGGPPLLLPGDRPPGGEPRGRGG